MRTTRGATTMAAHAKVRLRQISIEISFANERTTQPSWMAVWRRCRPCRSAKANTARASPTGRIRRGERLARPAIPRPGAGRPGSDNQRLGPLPTGGRTPRPRTGDVRVDALEQLAAKRSDDGLKRAEPIIPCDGIPNRSCKRKEKRSRQRRFFSKIPQISFCRRVGAPGFGRPAAMRRRRPRPRPRPLRRKSTSPVPELAG